MKLSTFISKLVQARNKYIEKHGTEPSIYEFYEGELHLCARLKKPSPGTTVAKKPYLWVRTGIKSLNS
jgi:hypothetical protein